MEPGGVGGRGGAKQADIIGNEFADNIGKHPDPKDTSNITHHKIPSYMEGVHMEPDHCM